MRWFQCEFKKSYDDNMKNFHYYENYFMGVYMWGKTHLIRQTLKTQIIVRPLN